MPDAVLALPLGQLRQTRGLTGAQLARRAGVTYRALRGWERRERQMGADDLRAIADALALRPDELAALVWWAGDATPAGPSRSRDRHR